MRKITNQEIAFLRDKVEEIKEAIKKLLPGKELNFMIGFMESDTFNFYFTTFYLSPNRAKNFATEVRYDRLSRETVDEIANDVCKAIERHCRRCGL